MLRTRGDSGGFFSRLLDVFLHGSSLWRYLVVGVGTSLLDFSLFTLLSVPLGWHTVVSNVISTIVTVCVSYLINQTFVFKSSGPTWASFFSFAGLTLVTGLVLQSAIVWTLVEVATAVAGALGQGLIRPSAKVVAMVVGATCNYLGYRWLFRARS